jgi:cyanate lyase
MLWPSILLVLSCLDLAEKTFLALTTDPVRLELPDLSFDPIDFLLYEILDP